MNIVIASIFRNSTGYLPFYVERVYQLAAALKLRGHGVRFVWVEGDSTDATWDVLAEERDAAFWPVTLVKREHGGPMWGSVDVDDRWAKLAWVHNGMLAEVKATDDVLLYVESDLMWNNATMLKLLGHLDTPGVDGVCPLSVIHTSPATFYDTWGHRSGGQKFGHHWPYHPMLTRPADPATGLYPMDSAGSCWVVKADVARAATFDGDPPLDIVAWCNNMRANGARLWLDPSVKVYHP